MKKIENITSDYKQKFNIQLEDGSNLLIYLEYRLTQNGWYYSLVNGDFEINNRKLITTTSLLYQFKNIINFDIMVYSSDLNDPYFIDDFSNGRIEIYILYKSDITTINSYYN